MADHRISVVESPAASLRDAVLAPLRDFNEQMAGPSGYAPFAVRLTDATGASSGGLWGHYSYDWLFVELLAVPEASRGRGLGRALLAEAERHATARGAIGIWLDTYSFQARGFYEKLGYRLFGELSDHPRGGARYFLQKRLAR